MKSSHDPKGTDSARNRDEKEMCRHLGQRHEDRRGKAKENL